MLERRVAGAHLKDSCEILQDNPKFRLSGVGSTKSLCEAVQVYFQSVVQIYKGIGMSLPRGTVSESPRFMHIITTIEALPSFKRHSKLRLIPSRVSWTCCVEVA